MTFEAPNVSPPSFALIGDAAMVASDAVARISRRRDSSTLLEKFDTVRFVEGQKVAAQVSERTLQITVAPKQGMAGRPSSDRIVAVAKSAR
jgi:hypothetical protein